jgi:peptidoglycan/xylan/chitin deacetylase (PgdA/CDA1 family)
MLYLKRCGLRGVSMRELHRATNMEGTKGLVGITFDDGYEDLLHNALSVMERLGFSATVFVVAGAMGEENRWKRVCDPVPRSKIFGAMDLREISARGMEVGAHSMTHVVLSGIEPEVLKREVNHARYVLSEMLDQKVEGFSYPYGILDSTVVEAVRQAGYAYACSVKGRVERSAYDLPRIPISEKDYLLRFKAKLKVYQLYSEIRPKYVSPSALE